MERNTRQRTAIREVFEKNAPPLAPQQVLELAQRKVPSLGIATVYRALKSLHEEGWLDAIDLPGHSLLYERAGKEHHHHFHCRKCGKFFEIKTCPQDLKRMLPRGFTLEEHELVLVGLCRKCSSPR